MSHTVPGHVARFCRLTKGLDQTEAAAMLGTTGQVQLSRWERGRGTIPPEAWTRAEQRLALGEPGARESSVIYLLAMCHEPNARKLRFDFLFDEFGQIGYYRSPVWANGVADALASLGLPGACAVPCWRSFARGLLKDRPRNPHQPGPRLYRVDDWPDEETNRVAMAGHVGGVVRDLQHAAAAHVEAAL